MSNGLFVAFPLFYNVTATWFSRWLEMDTTPMVDARPSRGVAIDDAMTYLIKEALKNQDWDRLVVYEHDVLPPRKSLVRVANYSSDFEIVGSVVCEHKWPHDPYIYLPDSHDEDKEFRYFPQDGLTEIFDEPALYEVGAVGFGFTSIARHVLQDWPADVPMFKNSRESHDLWFCRQARKLGHHVFVDTGIHCDHLTETAISTEHYKEADMEPVLGKWQYLRFPVS
jgi:hypothetical protein